MNSPNFSGLIVRRGEVEKVVPDLIQTIGKSNVHAVAFQEEVSDVISLMNRDKGSLDNVISEVL